MKKAENWDDAKEKMTDYRERSKERLESADIKTAKALQEQVLADIAKAVALVEERCSVNDVRIYKEWSLRIANNVAKASSEGGFLGFGGTDVSANEQALIVQIETVLGVDTSALFA